MTQSKSDRAKSRAGKSEQNRHPAEPDPEGRNRRSQQVASRGFVSWPSHDVGHDAEGDSTRVFRVARVLSSSTREREAAEHPPPRVEDRLV